MAPKPLAMSREFLLRMALSLSDDQEFLRQANNPLLPGHANVLAMLRAWAISGAQSVTMPATFAAALAATESRGCLEGARLPWDAFEIQVPAELLPVPGEGCVHSVFVADINKASLIAKTPRNFGVLISSDKKPRSMGFVSLSEMRGSDERIASGASYDMGVEQRVWSTALRLVAGVILSIESARTEAPGAFPAGPVRTKRDKLRPNTFVLGKPLKLDCREAVRDFVAGNRKSAPNVTTLVRGHWVNQPYGPGSTLRRLQWRQPHWRGDGPILVRETRIGSERPE